MVAFVCVTTARESVGDEGTDLSGVINCCICSGGSVILDGMYREEEEEEEQEEKSLIYTFSFVCLFPPPLSLPPNALFPSPPLILKLNQG